MQYLDQKAKVDDMSKDGKSNKVFDVLEWLAAICSHVPDKGERPVILRYYGITVITATSPGENDKRSRPMILSPVSSNPLEVQRNNEKNGRG